MRSLKKTFIAPIMKEPSTSIPLKTKRQCNIELLRIFSMFMIVFSHYIDHGIRNLHAHYNRFHPEIAADLFNYLSLHFCYLFTKTGVDCFVLISGYFLIEKKQIRGSIFRLWFQVIFYSIGIGLVLFCLNQFKDFSATYVWESLSPFPEGKYWFVSQYMALMLLAPFLAQLAAYLNQRQMLYLLCILLILFFYWPFGERFTNGMDLGWFVYLFLVGGYLRKYGVPEWVRKHTGTLIGACALLFLLIQVAPKISRYLSSRVVFTIPLVQNHDFTFFLSVLLFIYFANRPWEGKLAQCISRIAPYTFGVYLIHDFPLIRTLLWSDLLKTYNFSPYAIAGLFFSLLVFLSGIIIDSVRAKIFEVCRINLLARKIGNLIPQPFDTKHNPSCKNKQI